MFSKETDPVLRTKRFTVKVLHHLEDHLLAPPMAPSEVDQKRRKVIRVIGLGIGGIVVGGGLFWARELSKKKEKEVISLSSFEIKEYKHLLLANGTHHFVFGLNPKAINELLADRRLGWMRRAAVYGRKMGVLLKEAKTSSTFKIYTEPLVTIFIEKSPQAGAAILAHAEEEGISLEEAMKEERLAISRGVSSRFAAYLIGASREMEGITLKKEDLDREFFEKFREQKEEELPLLVLEIDEKWYLGPNQKR